MVTSTQGPPLAATVLLATGHPPLLRLPQHTLSALLEPIQGQGAFSLSITDSMVGHDTPPRGWVRVLVALG